MSDDNNKMINLVDKLLEANQAYEAGSPIMSDFEYDGLYDELLQLEAASGRVLAYSPTVNVGHLVVSSLNKVEHTTPMLSLDKTKDITKLEAFLADDRQGVLSWKLDGLSLVIKYANGLLANAITRGNGLIGEDVTHNARFICNMPKSIEYKGELLIRGEAIISFTEFERINQNLEGHEAYKNPRNLCAGTLRQLNSRIAAARKVRYYPFSLVQGPSFEKKSQELEFLQEQGFELGHFCIVNSHDVATRVEHFKGIVSKQDFATDGLVLTYDDVAYSKSLGATSKFPKDSIAFKWQDELAKTRLITVDWNPSRTGLINPIALFEPVIIEGTKVERASLHNISILQGLGLGVGDEISVYKANMIIPQIAENFTRSGTLAPPDNCPACGKQTTIKEENNTKTLHCANTACSAKLLYSIRHYASRDAMNIEGFSQQTAQKFIELGFIKDFSDIYRLDGHAEEIKSLKGFGEKSFNKLIEAIEKSKKAQLPNFIYGLGIDNVGLAGAKLLCTRFDHDIAQIRAAAFEDFEGIEGFGEAIANALCNYFADADNARVVDNALSYISLTKVSAKNHDANIEESGIYNKVFVITGKLESFENRKDLQSLIESKGGKVTTSVSANTHYLINNDAASASAKNKKALDLGVEIITEEEFLKLITKE